ncbi:MAG: NAD(P)H:quinone oxidoreductase [Chloroflexi bacterium]|nr:NAD(P)H:quinone oxidoreductase [Chloroflexota bacterium]OQA94112.1 MAG: NAD(P)H dehydrogenase (quinone) [Chloroflexi bacterium ADurb.Bin222]HOS80804.1 NAD(P)H:quinone oxidoreductase [Anaerolineae bacterium]HQJ12437.1 NAD(P)H:quinone oxidoreductase [Anaerolineae bacterium]
MSQVKLTIVYYSSTGTNYQMALAAKAAAEAAGAEVRLRKVAELAPDAAIDSNPAWRAHVNATRDVPVVSPADMEWANAYLFGTPTRYGNVASQMKQFIDTLGGLWLQGSLSNKPVAAFTSAMNVHGGQESTLLALYHTFYHWGSIIVPPGYTDPAFYAAGGNPYGVSATADPQQPEVAEATLEAVRVMTRRLVQVAGWLLKGQAA